MKLAVAMSGGVDSSVAAWLLKGQGHALVGVTLRLHDCTGMDDVSDARAMALQMGMEHHVFDLSDHFRACVMDNFVSEYERGRTPNPCVECNRKVKFGALLDKAGELGCGAVATGHYARLEQDTGSGRWLLKTALHPEKDQSYVLYCLSQSQLARSRFPLGALSKEEIRAIALEQGWSVPIRRTVRIFALFLMGTMPPLSAGIRARSILPGPLWRRMAGCWGGMRASLLIPLVSAGGWEYPVPTDGCT